MTFRHVAECLPAFARAVVRAPDSDLVARWRAGLPVTKAEVIATIESLEELDGYEAALRASGRAREPAEAAALVARRRLLQARAA
jgi:nucleoid-associated protein YgaU